MDKSLKIAIIALVFAFIGVAGTGTSGFVSPLTTKGDLYGFDAADARVPVGADGEVLTADSTDAQGVKWAPVSGGVTNATVNFYSGNHSNLTQGLNWSDSGHNITSDVQYNGYRITNASFAQLFNSGTAGFDIRNTNSPVVNSVAVGTVGNSNTYGNWNSTLNNVSDSTLNVWALRLGVNGSQAEKLRIIWVKSNDPRPQNSIGGDTEYKNIPLEVYQNLSTNFTSPNLVFNGMSTTDPSASANRYVCWDSGTNKTFLATSC